MYPLRAMLEVAENCCAEDNRSAIRASELRRINPSSVILDQSQDENSHQMDSTVAKNYNV